MMMPWRMYALYATAGRRARGIAPTSPLRPGGMAGAAVSLKLNQSDGICASLRAGPIEKKSVP